jgi:penicillin-binding protein 1C
VSCTLDDRLQAFVLESLDHDLTLIRESNVYDAAVLVADNRTGEVLAYAGNAGRSSTAFYVDGVRAPRQAGSTLKPFLYSLAIERRLLTAASLLDDSPVHVATPTGLYVPRNYDSIFRGQVTLRTALSSSLNVPAVRSLLVVGVGPFLDYLRGLGFTSLTEEPEFYGYSIALGSADVTLWELTNAYRTLSNGGRWSAMRLTGGAPAQDRRAMDESAAYIISNILSDREARSETFGLENLLSTRFWTAVKTGTSKDMRDNWCVGYSGRYTVGVWVGNFSGEPMHNVSGVSGAAPVWTEIMNYLHAKTPSSPPKKPPDVAIASVTFDEGSVGQGRQEFFVTGTEPVSTVSQETRYRRTFIAYPSTDTLIAIDPDIPDELQLVPLRFEGGDRKYEWVIDGERTGVSSQLLLWRPRFGTHEVSIVDGSNHVIDSVTFAVR